MVKFLNCLNGSFLVKGEKMTFSHEGVLNDIALQSDEAERRLLFQPSAKGSPILGGQYRVAVGPRADYGGVEVNIAGGEVFSETYFYHGVKEKYFSRKDLLSIVERQKKHRDQRMGETLTLVRAKIGREVEIYLGETAFTPDYYEIISAKGELSEQDNFLFENLRRTVAGLQAASDEVFAQASEMGLITLRSVKPMPGKIYRAGWLLPAVSLGLDLRQEAFKDLPARNVFCLVPEFTSAEVAQKIENRLFCRGESKGQLVAIEIA